MSKIEVLADLERPFAVMMAGIPGSGKSRFAAGITELLDDSVLISPDSIRQEMTGDANDQTMNSEVWEKAHNLAISALKQRQVPIIDATHARSVERIKDVVLYKSMGALSVVCIYIVSDTGTARQRNRARDRVVPDVAMDRMEDYLRKNPPTEKDGFDHVIKINNS